MVFSKILNSTKNIFNKNLVRYSSSAVAAAVKDTKTAGKLTGISSSLKVESHGATKVGVFDVESPLTTAVICFNSGSRYEPTSALGISHLFSHTLLATNKRDNVVDVVRPLFAIGADLKVLNDRENLYIVTRAHRDYIDDAISIVTDCLHKHSNKYHEFSYSLDSCLIDYDNIVENAPHAYLLDAVHEYVFRTGLGNSLYVKPDVGSRIQYTIMNDYRLNTITSKGAVACHGQLRGIPEVAGFIGNYGDADQMLLRGDAMVTLEKSPSASFCPGELRIPLSRKTTHVALVMPGSSYNSPDYWKYLILQKYLANNPEKSYFPRSHSVLSSHIDSLSNFSPEVNVDAFNCSYRDTGLFGVWMTAANDKIHQLTSDVTKKITQIGSGSEKIDPTLFKSAQKCIKLAYLSQYESVENLTVNLAKQLTESGSYTSPLELVSKIDSVSFEEFEKFAKKVLSVNRSSLLLASLGDVQKVGTLDTYFKL